MNRHLPHENDRAMTITIETMKRNDWKQVREIFADGLAAGMAAFTTVAPGWQRWNAEHLKLGRLVARDGNGRVLGFAALTPVPDT